jgi:hypothetical protein
MTNRGKGPVPRKAKTSPKAQSMSEGIIAGELTKLWQEDPILCKKSMQTFELWVKLEAIETFVLEFIDKPIQKGRNIQYKIRVFTLRWLVHFWYQYILCSLTELIYLQSFDLF